MTVYHRYYDADYLNASGPPAWELAAHKRGFMSWEQGPLAGKILLQDLLKRLKYLNQI
jgi:hypothetical protein